jgi:hypothetical protein
LWSPGGEGHWPRFGDVGPASTSLRFPRGKGLAGAHAAVTALPLQRTASDGGIALLANGIVGGLLFLVIAVPTGLYARCGFRGGRFRLLFW